MSRVIQQVNLLPSLEPPKVEVFLPVAKVVRWLYVMAGVLTLLTLIGVWWWVDSYQQLRAAQSKHEEVSKVVLRLQSHPDKQVNAALQAAVTSLAEKVDNKKALIALLSSEANADHSGFSRYLVDLAKTIPDNVWLKRIVVSDEGILLAGRVKQAELVAQFAHDLHDATSFKQVTFKRMDIDHDSSTSGVAFELATSQDMEDQS